MLDLSRPTPVWVVWPYLSSLEKLLFMGLMVLGIYVLLSAVFTVLRVRRGRKLQGISSDAQTVTALRMRSKRVDRLITLAFYLFGWVLFLGFQGAYFTLADGKGTVVWSILQDFEPHFAFAANVFFVFLMLHATAWFISFRIDRAGR